MSRRIYFGLVLLCLSVLSACSSSYRYYKAGESYISLNKYKSFAWAPTLPARRPDSVVSNSKDLGARLNYINNKRYFNNDAAARKIKEATIANLQSKGLVLQENNADLLVRYSTLVDRGARTGYRYPYYGGFYGGWGLGWGWGYRFSPWYYGAWGWPGYYGAMSVREHFKEGVLAIELIDSRTRETVWIGYGAGELNRNPEKSIAQLPKVVDDIFKQLPVSR